MTRILFILTTCFLLLGFCRPNKIGRASSKKAGSKIMEKVSLSTKTKIAAWWINLLAIGGIGLSLYFFVTLLTIGIGRVGTRLSLFDFLFPGFGIIMGSILCWISFQLLIHKRKWAWWVIIVWLSIILLISIIRRKLEIPDLFIFIPLLLFLLDRKNFWKVAK